MVPEFPSTFSSGSKVNVMFHPVKFNNSILCIVGLMAVATRRALFLRLCSTAAVPVFVGSRRLLRSCSSLFLVGPFRYPFCCFDSLFIELSLVVYWTINDSEHPTYNSFSFCLLFVSNTCVFSWKIRMRMSHLPLSLRVKPEPIKWLWVHYLVRIRLRHWFNKPCPLVILRYISVVPSTI